MTTSTQSNLSLEEIAAHNPGPKWFQLYVPKDRGVTARAAAARQGRRLHRDRADRRQRLRLSARGEHPQRIPAAALARQGQPAPRSIPIRHAAIAALNDRKRDLNWDDMEWIKPESGLAVIVKGVLSPKVAAIGGQARTGRGLDLQPRRPRLRRRAGDDQRAAAHRRRGRRPRPDHPRWRRPARHRRVQGAGARGRCRRLRASGAVRPRARRRQGAQSVLEYLRDNLTLVMRLAGTASVKDISIENLVQEAEA